MAEYRISKICEIIGGSFLAEGEDLIVTRLLTDSRKVSGTEGTVFFALKGPRNNGHNYVQLLYDKGIRNFIVSEDVDALEHPEANIILVPDTLKALQDLTRWHRLQFNLPIIAITGSNGKTIVKEWLYQLLKEDFNIVRSPKSYNSQVGVPISVWQIDEEHTLGIFEAGISFPGEMKNLQLILNPDDGVFTNLGEAHAENFESPAEKAAEKLELFNGCRNLVYCRDYTVIDQKVRESKILTDTRTFTWSRRTRADLQVTKIAKGNIETEINAIYRNHFIRIFIPFIDEASIENAVTCWCYMLMKGYDNEIIAERMKLLTPVEMRLELKEGINNCLIVNDTYNSDLGSLSIALDFINQQKHQERKTVILSDILQTGKKQEALYHEVAEMLSKKGISRLIGIGEAISNQKNIFSVPAHFYSTTDEFLNSFRHELFHDEIVLVKGARIFGFEQITRKLQQKAHETVLEINLNALVNNLNYYRSRLKPSTRIMAMVKAFSYGSGSFEIANVLQFHHIDYLAVAYADEGIELRKAGIRLPVMVMNPEEQSYDSMIQHNLEPEIFSMRILHLFEEAVRRHASRLKEPVKIHIKLDTGMHRLGFEEKDLNELIVRVKNNKLLKVYSVFSHLAGSDEHQHDAFTIDQIRRFSEMADTIQSHFDHPILKHILNSAGILRFPDAQFDMVRLGIGLYGIGTNEYEQSFLQNVSTLKTTISQIKKVQPGDTIGYGRKAVVEREMVIATVPIGYADGLNRRLSNGRGKMIVKGKKAPVVGNICMDMCMIDITGINAKEGDEVVVFGDQKPIKELAAELETIPYEVLTNVSRRVKRVYYYE